MQVKQPKYIRSAYVTLLALCIIIAAPVSAYAANTCSMSPTTSNETASDTGNDQRSVSITNQSDDAWYWEYSINNTDYTLTDIKLSNGQPLDPAFYQKTITPTKVTVHALISAVRIGSGQTRVNNVVFTKNRLTSGVVFTARAGDVNANYGSCSGAYTLRSVTAPPPSGRIISTEQGQQFVTDTTTVIKDNFWFILALLAFIVGLLLLSRWLEKKEMGARRV